MDCADSRRRPVIDPTVEPEPRGFRAKGTTTMVAGGLIGAVLAYVFQAMGGRVLGTEGFAPIASIWTAFFIVGSILLVPLEQYVARESSRGRAALSNRRVLYGVAALGVVAGSAYVGLSLNGPVFAGNSVYIVVMGLVVVGYTLLFAAKGVFAGRRRFAAVGWLLIAENGLRLVAGAALLFAVAEAEFLVWAMVIAPLCVLGFRFWRYDERTADVEPASPVSFLGGYFGASVASQILLAGAPIGVELLGGGAAMFSVVFVVFTLFRAPLTLIYALQSRILPYLVVMAGDEDEEGLVSIARKVLMGGLGLSLLGAAVGWLVGADVVTLLFSEEFRPGRLVAMLVAGGVMVASTTQIAGQVLVARGMTGTLARVWGAGLVMALVALFVSSGAADLRVAIAFASGEVVAALTVAWMILRPSRRPLGAVVR